MDTELAVRTIKAYDLVLMGHTVDYAANMLGISYVEAAAQVDFELRKRTFEKANAKELEAARLDKALIAIAPAVDRGETTAIRVWRELSESRRKLYGLDENRESDGGVTVEIAFSFANNARVQVAGAVSRSEAHGLRPAPDLLDSDGDEDREDNRGGCLDLGRDSVR